MQRNIKNKGSAINRADTVLQDGKYTMFFNSFCWSTRLSKGMDFVVYIWNSMKWNFNRLLWQIRNKKTMELSGVIYRKLFLKKGKIWIAVFGVPGEALWKAGSFIISKWNGSKWNASNWNERCRTQGFRRGDQWCLRLFQRIGEAWLKVFRQKGDVGKPFAQSAGKEKSKNRSALYTLNEKVA